MIEFFLGKTGGGKSYLALKRIVEFLTEHPDGYVVTNLAIRLAELNAYLKEQYPNIEPDVVGRVRILSEEETKRFYLHRGPGENLDAVSKEDERALKFPDFRAFAENSRQVLYVIDEAHIFFDAREWANVGLTLNFFASQHRKFRSDIIFITQFLKQVELRLREHSTSFSECMNFGLRKFMFWAMPGVFRVLVTYKAPPCPSENASTYPINPKLAACYDTTAGVGTRGGFKPEVKRRKGWPFWTLPVALVLGVVAVAQLPELGLNLFLGNSTPDIKTPGASSPAAKAPLSWETFAKGPDVGQFPKTEIEKPAKAPLRVTGYLVTGNVARVNLSDGRVVFQSDPEFGGIHPRGGGVWISGVRVPMETRLQPKQPNTGKSVPDPIPGETARSDEYRGEMVIPTKDSAERAAAATADGFAVAPPAKNQQSAGARR